MQRGLKSNLGVLESQTGDRVARAERLRALSALLPTLSTTVSENLQQSNLAIFGFRFPGVHPIIGPYNYFDARANADVTLYNRAAQLGLRSVEQNLRATQFAVQDARDLVVQAVANAYLTIVADEARMDAARVEVSTAQALFENARDQHAAGLLPAIDELRAQVEWRSRQQRLLAVGNRFAKDKLALAQVIGLPAAQTFELSSETPYAPLDEFSAEQMSQRARQSRADYQSLRAQLQGAQMRRDAELARRLPTVSMNANYGLNGINPAQSHGTFGISGTVKFSLFDGGRLSADVAEADAIIQQRKDAIADLENRMDVEIRGALLDLQSAADQVTVAASTVDLASRTLEQARDRFTAGVTNNIEVVQAQSSVAQARENLIASRYEHNLAKVALARAVGATETSLKQFMGVK